MKNEQLSLKTKKALAASLKEAMRHKAFSKITVKEIIQSCGVNRNTFYYHFEDIYSLLRWMLTEEAIDVVKHFDLLVDYEDAICFIMDYVDEVCDLNINQVNKIKEISIKTVKGLVEQINSKNE